MSLSCIFFEIKQDIGPKSRFFHTPRPAFDATVRESLSEYCDNVECGTTRMVWRPDGDKTVIRLAVLTQYQRVTDGQTDIVCDGRTDGHRVLRTDRRPSCDGRTDRRTSCVTDRQTDIV